MKIEDIDAQFHELSRQMKQGEDAFTRGDFEQSIQLYSKCLPMLTSSYGETHSETQLCMDRLANAHFSLHHYDEALPILRRLIAIKLRSPAESGAELPQLYFVLARTNTRLGKWEDADECYKSALGLAEKQFGRRSSFVAAILEGHAALLKLDGAESAEAAQLQDQARQVRASLVDQSMSSRMNKLNILARYAQNADGVKNEEQTDQPAEPNNENSESKISRGSITDNRLPSQSLTGLRSLELERELKSNRLPMTIVLFILTFAGITLLFTGDGATRISDLFSRVSSQLTGGAQSHQDPGTAGRSGEETTKSTQLFESLDGQRQVKITSDNTFAMQYPSIGASGTYKFSDGHFSFKPPNDERTFVFRSTPVGLVDSEETPLYPAGAPELLVASKMRLLANVAQQYYMQYHQYPSKSDPLVFGAPALNYTNPVTKASMTPLIGRSLGLQVQSMNDFSLDDYARYESGFNQLSLSNSQPMIGPCAIEFYNIKFLRQGETFLIRGTDRHGRLLPGNTPSKAYVIILTQGRTGG